MSNLFCFREDYLTWLLVHGEQHASVDVFLINMYTDDRVIYDSHEKLCPNGQFFGRHKLNVTIASILKGKLIVHNGICYFGHTPHTCIIRTHQQHTIIMMSNGIRTSEVNEQDE